jgi:hypothetical protein
MKSTMVKNEDKRTATLVAPPKDAASKEAVNDFVNEGNPTVVKPAVNKAATEKIAKVLSKKK